jgi:hypothetical protein
MLVLLNVGDVCRTSGGRPARSVGYGWALAVSGDNVEMAPVAPPFDTGVPEELPTDLEVARVHLRLSNLMEGRRESPERCI